MELREVELLIIGAGWTSTFLIPLLQSQSVSFAATTTTGRDGTFKFVFDPSSDDLGPYRALPSAKTVLITFPLKGAGQSKHLVELYTQTHPHPHPGSTQKPQAQFLQLGSTGIFQNVPGQTLWVTRHSAYDASNDRAVAEDELRGLGGCVLNLAGLWGGSRQPRNFVNRVAPTKEALKGKKSLHMVHGKDVARAILGMHGSFTPGERWMLTDMFVYDWYALALGWGGGGDEGSNKDAEGPLPDWVRELMIEENVKALPRSVEGLGRCYDSREFWERLSISPVRARI